MNNRVRFLFWGPVTLVVGTSTFVLVKLLLAIRERQRQGSCRTLFYRLFTVQVKLISLFSGLIFSNNIFLIEKWSNKHLRLSMWLNYTVFQETLFFPEHHRILPHLPLPGWPTADQGSTGRPRVHYVPQWMVLPTILLLWHDGVFLQRAGKFVRIVFIHLGSPRFTEYPGYFHKIS